MFWILELMSLLINLLDIRWFQWKSEEQQDMVDWDYTSAFTKVGWTVFEKEKAKNGRWWQCKVDFVSNKSVVRSVSQETVHPSLIFILCCTNESDGNYAQIRPKCASRSFRTSKKCISVIKTQSDSAVNVFLGTTESSLNNQFVKTDSCKTTTMSFGETVTCQNVFLSENYSLGQVSFSISV
jgi:hypothetical protein